MVMIMVISIVVDFIFFVCLESLWYLELIWLIIVLMVLLRIFIIIISIMELISSMWVIVFIFS